MEILKRAEEGGEIISPFESEENVREEVNKRNAKLGRSTKYGESPYATKIMITVPSGKRKLNIWPRDENGNLIDD